MRVTLDTNRLTDAFRDDAALLTLLSSCDEVWVSLIVLGEIKAGFYGGLRQEYNEGRLREFLAMPTAGVLIPDRETADHFARLAAQLKRAGTPLPTNDIWIAALTIQHDLILLTRDKHFEKIPQLLCR